jgi:outer membrane protein OmpA-like peptidoglycan-associated protein
MQEVAGLISSQSGSDAAAVNPAITTVSPTGSSLLSTLFGGRVGGIADIIAEHAGLKSSSATSLLTMAAPLVLSAIGSKTHGAGASGIASTLMAEKDSILNALPSGLGSMLGLGSLGAFADNARSRFSEPVAAGDITRVVTPDTASGSRWWIPLIIVIAVLAARWLYFGRSRGADTAIATADSAMQSMGNAIDSTARVAANAATGAASDLGAFISEKLPDGIDLSIPSRGVESRLIAFIQDPNAQVSDTLWFNFDRLNFETGSTKLSDDSSDQLDNIAAILKAYPDVNMKIGGYTDNTGDAAANMKLSQTRADAVRAALVSRGIAGSRLSAEGYGDAHPIADNSTPDGRAQNRRIAMRVTKK